MAASARRAKRRWPDSKLPPRQVGLLSLLVDGGNLRTAASELVRRQPRDGGLAFAQHLPEAAGTFQVGSPCQAASVPDSSAEA